MLYDVRLQIIQAYTPAASASRHVLRLLPRDIPGVQRLISGHVACDPLPDDRGDRWDFFGNAASDVAFNAAHGQILFHMRARVERHALYGGQGAATALAALAGERAAFRSLDPGSPHHFVGRSARIEPFAAATAYAAQVVTPTMSALDAVVAIGEAIHRDFCFVPGVTTVETPVEEVLSARLGVCQDFAHVMIACLRGLDIPAGYVSGFLRTSPPPGQPRLEGADAMHAWVRAWCGAALGWVEYDPTNALAVGGDHIVVAYGRDYSDTAPIVGALRSEGTQATQHAVDVTPVAGDGDRRQVASPAS